MISNKYGAEKNSLLHLAAKKGHLELIESILDEGAKVDALNEGGESAICLAAKKGHTNVVKLLLKKRAECSSVLHLAIKSNNLELLKVVLTNRRLSSLDSSEVPMSVNSPTHDILTKCIEHKNTANKKLKKYNKIIGVSVSVSAIAVAIYIGLTTTTISSAIIFTAIMGILVLVVAIIISEMSKRYIENEFQKKMFIELGDQTVYREKSEIPSILSDVEIQSAPFVEVKL